MAEQKQGSKTNRENVANTGNAGNSGCVYDAQLKLLLHDKEYIADVCNAMIYGGRKFITPRMLKPHPVEQNAVRARQNGGFATDNRFRDLAYFVKRGSGEGGFLLCLEVQTSQDAGMPLRVLEYNTRELIRFSNDVDYQSTHKLPLVTTLVLNFSDGPWTGPKSLLGMAEYRDAWLDKAAEQSRLLLLDPYAMNDKMLSNFCTDLKFMLCCWRFSRDDVALQAFLESQKGLIFPSREMRRALYMFFNIEFDDKEEKADGGIGVMCEAIRKIREKGIKEGKDIGIKEGKDIGIKEGKDIGIKEGMTKGKEDVAVNALRMKLSVRTIQKLTGLSLEKINKIAQSVAML